MFPIDTQLDEIPVTQLLTFTTRFHCLARFSIGLVSYLPKHISLPAMPAHFRVALIAICNGTGTSNLALHKAWSGVYKSSHTLEECMDIIAEMSRQDIVRTGADRMARVAIRTAPMTWWDCQATIAKPADTPCAPRVGEQMFTCSRVSNLSCVTLSGEYRC